MQLIKAQDMSTHTRHTQQYVAHWLLIWGDVLLNTVTEHFSSDSRDSLYHCSQGAHSARRKLYTMSTQLNYHAIHCSETAGQKATAASVCIFYLLNRSANTFISSDFKYCQSKNHKVWRWSAFSLCHEPSREENINAQHLQPLRILQSLEIRCSIPTKLHLANRHCHKYMSL